MAAPLALIVGDVVSAYADVPIEPHLLDGTASTPSAAELVPEETLVQALVAGVRQVGNACPLTLTLPRDSGGLR